MYRVFKLFCILMLGSSSLLSQSQVEEEVLYLKDGSVIRGEIVDRNNSKVRIKTRNGNIWSFDQLSVDSIVMEKSVSRQNFLKTHLHFIITDFGVLAGSSNNSKSHPFSLHMINNYLFKDNFSTGIGVGVEFFEEAVCPLFMDGRFLFDLGNNNSFPLLYAKIGYSFSLEDRKEEFGYVFDSKGGPMAGLGIGYVFVLNDRNAITFNIGYRFQQLEHVRTNDWSDERFYRYEKYNRFAIKIGLLID